jgi:hypothetical protein
MMASCWEFDVGSKRYLCALTEEEQQTVTEVDEWFTVHHPAHEEGGVHMQEETEVEEEEKMDVVSKPSGLLKSAAVRCVARVDDDGDDEEDDEPVPSTAAKENTVSRVNVNVNANARKRGPEPQAVLPKKRPADINKTKTVTASTSAAVKSNNQKKKKVADDLMSEAELKALLKKHNKKLAPKPTYVAPLHSVRDVRAWEIKSGKSWQCLTVEEKDAANQEIELSKRR